jgi:hypothetical protein
LIRSQRLWYVDCMKKYVLSQGVELPHLVKYNVVPMLKVQKLLQLTAEQTRRQVMCTKGSTEFTP